MLTSFRTALKYLNRSERTKYFLLVFVRSIIGVLDIIGIALVGILAGLATNTIGSASGGVTILGYELPIVGQQTLVLLLIAVLVVFTLKAFLAIFAGRALTNFLAKIETEKAVEIVKSVFSNGLLLAHKHSRAKLLWTLTGSTATAFSGMLVLVATFISEGFLLILVALSFVLIDPVAAVSVFIYFGMVIVALQLFIAKSLKRAGQNAGTGGMQTTQSVDDLQSAFREITILGRSNYFLARFAKSRAKLSQANGTMIFLGGMPRYVVETALMLGVVAFIGVQFLTGQLADGFVTVGVFLTGGVRIMASLLPLQAAVANAKSQSEQAREALSAVEEAQQLSLTPTEIYKEWNGAQESTASKEIPSAIGLKLTDISFKYPGAHTNALAAVSLEVKPGSHVAIIGPSGSGKTTLVDLILGLLPPETGQINFFSSNSVEILSIHNGLVAYVPQRPGIIAGTIAENIALGVDPSEIDESRVTDVLSQVQLADFVTNLPKGIQTSLAGSQAKLSGGQIQRVGLARALYTNPKLIVLDEATSALDAESESLVTSAVANLGEAVTVITIAHRLSTVQHSDDVFVIEEGRVVATGKFDYLRETVPMVAEYVRLMSFD